MSLLYTYIDAISKGYPGVNCYSAGDGSIYENIIWQEGPPLPSKADLDAWIAADIKVDMWDAIKAERDRRKNDGGYKVGANWYHSDTSSRIQQLGLVMMGANLPANLYWKTMGGGFVVMTQTLALQIFQTAAASDMAIFTVAEQKKAAMLASADPATYDYLSGWPLIYGE
jgi:hypothetical protein